jgi:hypothetical protein
MSSHSYPLLLAKDRGCGLCNQLYALAGCIDFAITNRSFDTIVLDDFLQEIHSDAWSSASDIIDLKQMNAYLLPKYGIQLMSKADAAPKIHSIRIENEPFDITASILEKHLCQDLLYIGSNTILKGPGRLVIDYTIFGGQKKHIEVPIGKNGCLTSDVLIYLHVPTFQPSPQLYFGGSKDPPLFVDILQHIAFHPRLTNLFTTSTYPLKQNYIQRARVNLLHLRLEDDAVTSFALQNRVQKEAFKRYMEEKYIAAIDKHIVPKDVTIVIAADYDNRVIEHLQKRGYQFTLTPKIHSKRELNAINDMMYTSFCNNVFIGIYESSYSYTLMFRLFYNGVNNGVNYNGVNNGVNNEEKNTKAVILVMNAPQKKESVFDKDSPLERVRMATFS